MDFDIIAELTRLTARLSLLLFAAAMVLDATRSGQRLILHLWVAFVVAHAIHLIFVLLYYWSLGQPPIMDLVLGLLLLGLAALVWLFRITISRGPEAGDLYVPNVIVWYLWFLFAATHISRLADPERAGPVNWIMLAVMMMAAFARGAVVLRGAR